MIQVSMFKVYYFKYRKPRVIPADPIRWGSCTGKIQRPSAGGAKFLKLFNTHIDYV